MNQIDTILEEQLKLAPENLRDHIVSESWMNIIEDFGSKLNLSQDDIDIIQREFLFVLLGIENPEDISDIIAAETTLTKDQARELLISLYPEIIGKYEREILELLDKQDEKDSGGKLNEEKMRDHLPTHESRIPTPEEIERMPVAQKEIEREEPLDMWERYEKEEVTRSVPVKTSQQQEKFDRDQILREIEEPIPQKSVINQREQARKALAGENYQTKIESAPEREKMAQTPDYSTENQEEILKPKNDPYREIV